MLRETPFVVGETYHIYNRGAHKEKIFRSASDYERFLVHLFLANNADPIHVSKLAVTPKYQGRSLMSIFEGEIPDRSLVDILAYSLMPNHFHLIIKEKREGGITLFMKKLMTGYAMYFNIKYDHSGVLFQGRFKSKHLSDEAYFRYIFTYVHLNPLELVEPRWKEGHVADPTKAWNYMNQYIYSSFIDYSVAARPCRAIIAYDQAPPFLKTQNDLEELLQELTSRTVLEV